MEKMPNFNDVFLSIMASFIGFGLVIGIAQAAFDFGGGRSLLLSSPVFAQTLGDATPGTVPTGVTSCPTGQTLLYSNNYATGTGYCGCLAGYTFQYPNNIGADRGNCIIASSVATSTVVSSVCPEGYEKTPTLWTDSIRRACTLAAQQLKLLDTQCIANAVEKRDNAILAGMDSGYSTQRNLIVVRERDLRNAWLQFPDRKLRRAEILRIWTKYRADVRYMQRQSTILKTNTWKQYALDRKTCGTYATSDDYTNVSVDSGLQLFAPTL
jgi:hypothetical protein